MPWNPLLITVNRMYHCKLNFNYLFGFVVLVILSGWRSPEFPGQFPPDAPGFVITIDAGHGGHDPGALGKRAREKDLALKIARKFGKLIESQTNDVKVVYTRSTDVFIPLDERAAIANRNESDLFVSIHLNANKNKGLTGSETYVMGLSKSDENMDVVMQENKVMKLEENYETKYEGFDPTSQASYIKFNLLQNDNLNQSLEFATIMQDKFRIKASRTDRGVRQGPFWVLWATAMPSVIIETGYISNLTEEEFLMSESGQELLASAIFEAFMEYKRVVELRRTSLVQPEEASNESSKPVGTDTGAKQLPKSGPVNNIAKIARTDTVQPVKDTVTSKKVILSDTGSGIEFRVQVLSSVSKIPAGSKEFKGHRDLAEIRIGGQYKYMSAPVKDYQEAMELRKKLADVFPGAFVVPFRKGIRITLEEATGK